MKPEIGLNIGDQCIRLCLDRDMAGLQEHLEKRFEEYRAPPLPDAVRIYVSSWARRHSFDWDPQTIRSLEAGIKAALLRVPQTHPVEERLAKALRILRHAGPQSAAFQHIGCDNGGAQSLVFAMSGANLFFYQPSMRRASILLKKGLRKDPMVAGVLNGIMFALSYRLIQSGGLLLHGCAFERGGKTVLMVGRSGAGKTTAARLCRPGVCFADDGVVLVADSEGYCVQPSPFRQLEIFGEPRPGIPGRLEAIFLLEKHCSDRVSELEKHEMMMFILRHAIHFFKYFDDTTARRGFKTVKDLLDLLPTYRLQFTRKSDLWSLISS